MRRGTRERPPPEVKVDSPPASPALIATFLIVLTSGVVVLVGEVVELPLGLALSALGVLGVGALLSGVLAFRNARRQGRSFFRVVGKTVWAPIRFILDWW